MTFLQNRLTGLVEPAQVITPIQQPDVDCFIADWRPILDARIDELKRTGLYTLAGVSQHNVEDAHWTWPEKVKQRTGQLQWESFALRCDGRTQGVLYIDMLRRCRLPSQQNLHMVYIDLLATAPWNRRGLTPHPQYRGVGEVLMTEAIFHSNDEGFGGRIGLHSLPTAEKFYRTQWGMESLGPDPDYYGLTYFELTTERATEFMSP